MAFFLSAAGLMMIFEGIPFFCFPTQYKEWVSKLPEIPNSTLRTIGLVVMLLGLGLVYVGKSLTVTS